jgi:hypothetical protein
MGGMTPAAGSFSINRAPVLTLWAAVVAERLGYDRDAAVTFGRTVAGLNAASKARTLGLAKEKAAAEARTERTRAKGRTVEIELLGRSFDAVETEDGLRALAAGKPASASAVHHYLESKFGDHLAAARTAMTALAKSRTPKQLAEEAYALYEVFRPSIPRGVKGWGAKGVFDPAKVRALAKGGS